MYRRRLDNQQKTAQRDFTSVVCWGALPLDQDKLNTQFEILPTFMPPTDPVGFANSMVGASGGVGIPPKADAMLGMDVSLTRLLN